MARLDLSADEADELIKELCSTNQLTMQTEGKVAKTRNLK